MSAEMTNRYLNQDYARMHPTWHVEHSAWKARHVLAMLTRHSISPGTVCEIGCGAGEILKQLHDALPDHVRFVGYDISPQAHALSLTRASDRIEFRLEGFPSAAEPAADLLLLMDVLEHVEDYYGFLRAIRPHGHYKIFHIPLDVSAVAVLRGNFFDAVRVSAGHIHYFSRQTAIAALRDAGYEVLDWRYTGSAIDFPATSWKMRLARAPRRALFALCPELAVRLLGGFSALVLAR